MEFPVFMLSCATQLTFAFINCKHVDVTTGFGLTILNEYGINVADRNSLLFSVETCAENVFFVLSNTANTRSNPNASYYTLVFSNAINMIAVNCFKCPPVMAYPLTTVGTCNTKYELWIAWGRDGAIKVGQGRVLFEKTFMYLEEGNVTDIFYASFSAMKAANWSFTVEEDALEFLTPSPDGSTTVELSEDTTPGTTIVNITSNRPDLNITVDVYGNISVKYFYMDGLVLKTRQSLDFEAYQLHNVRLVTSEAITLSVKVIVTDVNDETPNVTCEETVELPEECPVGVAITFPCVITDADNGDEYNITIEGPDNDFFHVENGKQIKMARRLERDGETGRQALNISMVVQDLSGHTATHNMIVDVIDINDNYPMFSSPVYIINVTENNTLDVPILNLTVSDTDQGNNSNITVTLHNRDANDCHFRVDNLTLVLEAGNCDFEEFEMRDHTYSLTLRAQDNPASGQAKTAVTVVVIQVQARNEHIPYWNTTNVLQSKLTESQVTVTSKASNDREQMAQDNAQAQANTSSETSTMNLPRELRNTRYDNHTDGDKRMNNSEYIELNTTGTSAVNNRKVGHSEDGGTSTEDRLTTSFMFPIQNVSETANIGTIVYTLKAIDKDSSEHSQLSYSIMYSLSDKTEDASRTFDINTKSGDIVTSLPLDRDDPLNSSAYYTLFVTCSDGDFTINGTLMIQVMEENEFPPQFERTVRSVNFPTSLNDPMMITKFNVTDEDLHSDISLNFQNETPGFYLNIVSLSWELYFSKPLDLTSRFNLPTSLAVIATDNGTPELTSSAIVIFNQAICALPTTGNSLSTTTTSSPTVTSVTTQSPLPTTKECIHATKQPKENKKSQVGESEVLVLIIMAVTEGIIMILLLIVTGLVFTGRLFGNENEKKGILDSRMLEDREGALPLQRNVEQDVEQLLDDTVTMAAEEPDLEMSKDREKDDIPKTREDSGHGSLPSMENSDIKDDQATAL